MSLALITATLLLTCIGQITQKLTVQYWAQLPVGSGWSTYLRTCWPWLAIASLGGGLLCWLLVLQHTDVSVAYPMLSLNFLLITLAARLLFGEPVDRRHLAGLAMVVGGVCLLGAPA
nr:EamA family transporter [uncultured Pseudomonas sp.]